MTKRAQPPRKLHNRVRRCAVHVLGMVVGVVVVVVLMLVVMVVVVVVVVVVIVVAVVENLAMDVVETVIW